MFVVVPACIFIPFHPVHVIDRGFAVGHMKAAVATGIQPILYASCMSTKCSYDMNRKNMFFAGVICYAVVVQVEE